MIFFYISSYKYNERDIRRRQSAEGTKQCRLEGHFIGYLINNCSYQHNYVKVTYTINENTKP